MELKLKGLKPTITVTDYKMITSKVARVIISFTGTPTKENISSTLVKSFKGLAAPIEGSFRKLDKFSAVGYVRANRETRLTNEKEIRASFISASKNSNILMSNEDNSLWEVKEGAGNIYLARYGNEDLSSLIESTLSHNPNAPRISMVASVLPQPKELVAYVTDTGDVDYGFATKVGTKNVALVSYATRANTVIPASKVVASYEADISKETDLYIHKCLLAETKDNAKATMEDYYRKLYGYDQDYMNECIRQIEELSFV